jgi:hypothetical protein
LSYLSIRQFIFLEIHMTTFRAPEGTGADRVAARAALLAKIQADTKAAKAKAADRTTAIAAATKAYAKALTATKTAVILSSN